MQFKLMAGLRAATEHVLKDEEGDGA